MQPLADAGGAVIGGISDGIDAMGGLVSDGAEAAVDVAGDAGNFGISALRTVGDVLGSGAGLLGNFITDAPSDIVDGGRKISISDFIT